MDERRRAILIELINPAIGLVWALYWLSAEAGRMAGTVYPFDWDWTGVYLSEQAAWLLGASVFLLIGFSVALSRWYPMAALVVGFLALTVFVMRLGSMPSQWWPAMFGLLYAFGSIVAFCSSRLLAQLWWLALIAVLALSIAATVAWDAFPAEVLLTITLALGFAALVAVAGAAGLWVRRRRGDQVALWTARRERDRASAESAALAAREEIARDVHDIMAHSLAVIAVQADAARLQLEADHREVGRPVQSLRDIAEVSRDALRELRFVLDAAGDDERIQADTKSIDELIARTESTGHPVQRTDLGEPVELVSQQQRTLYRLVQEALTNAVKYAPAASDIELTLDWRDETLTLSVRSQLGEPGPQPAVSGRGIVGMTRRAELLGGWLSAGPDQAAGLFIVTAALPLATALAAPAEVAA